MENENNINGSDKNRLYRNLSILLKLFKNRPNHLAKYLIENSAFTEEFIYNIINSRKLNDMNPADAYNYFVEESNLTPVYFTDFDEMENFYTDIIENKSLTIDTGELTKELNLKLERYIGEEKYEEAAKMRDYMRKNNISINI